MKKLSFFNKIIFIVNTLFAIGLVFSFFLPNLSPNSFGIISLLSLLVPVLIIGNVLFVLYWILIGFKKQLLQSFLILILSYFLIPQLYKFDDNTTKEADSISIMSFNVRKFNMYKWINVNSIETKIKQFITEENPDVLALQEFRTIKNFKLDYPYFSNPPTWDYTDPIKLKNNRVGLAMYSKYPIINEGIIRHTKTLSSSMFIDIVKNKDTIRVYTFHLASLGIIPDANYFGHDDSEKLVKKVRQSFKVQQQQIDTLNKHVKSCKYKVILAGDLNNTAYSWAYKNVRNDFQDSFLVAGKGFGTTYKFKRFPFRIDYIFADKNFKINAHKNYDVKLSDHYPIKATLELVK
ncbi:endonuclease/exonuclease/phosphatase family protein [Aureibaculum sp. 2210JD6-5]|uniref:endonuclease/exonuclease/phosphatase family protein n=1 Tax=Aureibaculum sp. 2210JD6-5 TaxID=3103957 RepID=UPI002AAD2FEA|nr:endonuclease/exonuclease/phosphatase family protein [Aureibaculum sp. 2210JD6-5]MDY7395190.1 endonuclease/exonuclease/phosphatase family protein [Aureibaculum sp. 2210JD6-5]